MHDIVAHFVDIFQMHRISIGIFQMVSIIQCTLHCCIQLTLCMGVCLCALQLKAKLPIATFYNVSAIWVDLAVLFTFASYVVNFIYFNHKRVSEITLVIVRLGNTLNRAHVKNNGLLDCQAYLRFYVVDKCKQTCKTPTINERTMKQTKKKKK